MIKFPFLKKSSKAERYARYGAILSLGSPLGWAFIDYFWQLDMHHPYLFYYLIGGTCTSFTIFAFMIGKKIDDIEKLTQLDLLTNLYNQMTFLELSRKILDHCIRSKLPFTAALIDIDKFKLVNDKNNHLFGNYVIAQISKIIHEEVRSSDVASRFGGDEFALFLPDTSADQAIQLIERIRNRVAEKPFVKDQFHSKVTLSIGLSDKIKDHEKLEDLLRRADEALYKSKKDGRNRVSIL